MKTPSLLSMALLFASLATAQIDANIPLRVRPIQIEDPVEGATRAASLKLIIMQQQILQQEMETERLKREVSENQRQRESLIPAPLSEKAPPRVDLPKFTCSAANGRMWNGLLEPSKVGYLVGYSEGILASSTPLYKYFPTALSYGEVVQAMNAFYSDPTHALVRMLDAVEVVGKKANGADRSIVEDVTSHAITLANACVADDRGKLRSDPSSSPVEPQAVASQGIATPSTGAPSSAESRR